MKYLNINSNWIYMLLHCIIQVSLFIDQEENRHWFVLEEKIFTDDHNEEIEVDDEEEDDMEDEQSYEKDEEMSENSEQNIDLLEN